MQHQGARKTALSGAMQDGCCMVVLDPSGLPSGHWAPSKSAAENICHLLCSLSIGAAGEAEDEGLPETLGSKHLQRTPGANEHQRRTGVAAIDGSRDSLGEGGWGDQPSPSAEPPTNLKFRGYLREVRPPTSSFVCTLERYIRQSHHSGYLS